MAKLGDLVVNIGANTKDLNKKLGRVRRDMRQMSSNFTAVGQSMTRNLTMPLALIGGAAVKLAVDFESAMAQVKAVSGATAQDFKKLEQSAKDLGASTVFTAREVAALQLEYSRLGFSADEIIQVQEATLNLAQATGSDLAQAAEVAGATLRAFGMDASNTGRVTDVMAASFSASALNIDTFQDSMKYVAPIAKAAGVSMEETSAMLAVLANSGIKGSQAGTALRRILQEMQGTTGTLTERFAELASKGIGLEGAMDEVGRRAATSLLVLTEGAGQVDELTGSFENSEGAAKSMADVMNDTAKGGLKAMTSALEGAGIALGEVLIPFVTQAAEFIRDLASKFKDLGKDTQESIVKAAAFVAALGPILIILPKIVISMQALRAATIATSGAMASLGNVMGVAFGAKTLLGPTKYVAGLRSIIKVKNLLIAGLQRIPIIAAAAFAFAGIKHAIDEINTATEALKRYNEHKRIMLSLEKETAAFLEGENTRLKNQAAALKGSSNTIADYTSTLENLTIENARFWEAYESGETALSETEGTVKLSKEAYDILKEKMGDMIPMAADMLPAALQELRNQLEAKRQALIDASNVVVDVFNPSLEESKVVVSEMTLKLNELAHMGTMAFETLSNGVQEFTVSSSEQLLAFLNDFEVVSEQINNTATKTEDMFKSMGAAIGNTFGDLITGAVNGEEALKQFAKQVISALISTAIANAIASGSSASNPANQVSAGLTMPGFITSAMSVVAGAITQIPAFAEGGMVYGPGLAMVGDNKNAAVDPEVIAPLSKLKSIMGGNGTNVYGRISGDDIVISNDRATRDRNRFE